MVTPSQDDSVSVPGSAGLQHAEPQPRSVHSIVNNPVVFRWFATEVPFVSNGGTVIYNQCKPDSRAAPVERPGDRRYPARRTSRWNSPTAWIWISPIEARLFGGDASLHLTGEYILDLDLTAGFRRRRFRGSMAMRSRADLRLNGTFVWGADGFSAGSVVNYVDGFTDNRPGQPTRKIRFLYDRIPVSRLRPGTAFVSAVARGQRGPARRRQCVRRATAADRQRRARVRPLNNPPNPRTIGIVLTKKFGAK